MGRITHHLEMKKTQSGKSVITFSIAVDRNASADKITDFITVQAWDSQAEFISKYFDKGAMIAVQGRLQTRDYEGKDGTKKKAYEVIASQVSFCGGKKETNTDLPEGVDGSAITDVKEMEDLPF